MKLLLEQTVAINLPGQDGTTPLWIAVMNRDQRTVKLLLDNKADLTIPSSDGKTPLSLALEDDKDEILYCLVESMGPIDLENKDTNLLRVALANRQWSKSRILIEQHLKQHGQLGCPDSLEQSATNLFFRIMNELCEEENWRIKNSGPAFFQVHQLSRQRKRKEREDDSVDEDGQKHKRRHECDNVSNIGPSGV